MQREYRVFYHTAQSFDEKVQAVRVSVGDGIDENTIELLLLAQAKHEIAVKVGRPPDQVRINGYSLLSECR